MAAHDCVFMRSIVSGHAKLIVSSVYTMQENEQRATMLQLVDKVKNKQKDLGTLASVDQ